jgi:hypothetical protein
MREKIYRNMQYIIFKVRKYLKFKTQGIDRLKRMLSNPRDAKLLLWHVNHKTNEKI